MCRPVSLRQVSPASRATVATTRSAIRSTGTVFGSLATGSSASRTGTWYTCCSCEVEADPLPPIDAVVGVHVGLASCATRSDGAEIAHPRRSRHDEADRKRVSTLKDAAKNAQRWDAHRCHRKALVHIHERIANRRADFAQQWSRALVNTSQRIVVEDLAPLEMGRTCGMGQSILDVAWSQCISLTVAKAEAAGRHGVVVNSRATSTTCLSCGNSCRTRCATASRAARTVGWCWDVITLRRTMHAASGSPIGWNGTRVGRHT